MKLNPAQASNVIARTQVAIGDKLSKVLTNTDLLIGNVKMSIDLEFEVKEDGWMGNIKCLEIKVKSGVFG
jgi:hypothetical protein